MATVTKWNPFGVALNVTATAGTVTRTSATKYTVVLNVSWKCYWSGNKTNYGMTAASGGVTNTISAFNGTSRASGSSSFTGTYSISGTGAQTKSVTVTFRNFNTDNGDSATKAVTLNVSVPAWPTYAVKYNANGGSGAPSSQTKVKGTALKLSSTKPTRTGYTFQGWGTTASDTSVNYAAGASYTSDAAITLYAIWKANTFTVTYNANGGIGAPSSQTKTYGATLALSGVKPTRTNYNFLGWATSSGASSAEYASGASYTKNSSATLYAVWELAYWSPKITDISVERCDASGGDDDMGAYFKASFKWECCQLLGANNVSSLKVAWKAKDASSYSNEKTITPSGTTSGEQESHVFGGNLPVDASYDVRITVTDASSNSPNYTEAFASVMSYSFAVDFKAGGKGAGFGKPAEVDDMADFAWRIRSTASAETGDASAYQFQIVNSTDGTGTYYSAQRPDTGAHVLFGIGSGGVNHGIYSESMDKWLLYSNGENIMLYSPSGMFKPYFTAGDSIELLILASGFVTSNKSSVQFVVPVGKPIFGISSVTASSQTDGGLKMRQGGNYTHGSGASAYAKPASYSATYSPHGFVNVYATYDTTTNAVNNDACGVEAKIKLTFNA